VRGRARKGLRGLGKGVIQFLSPRRGVSHGYTRKKEEETRIGKISYHNGETANSGHRKGDALSFGRKGEVYSGYQIGN